MDVICMYYVVVIVDIIVITYNDTIESVGMLIH